MAGEPTWWESFKELLDTRFDNLDDRFDAISKALDLQAIEYARRLEDLNHAHKRAQDALNTFLREDKYDDNREADEQARKIALERIDERILHLDKGINQKLDAYITKAEARQAEMDQTIANQKGAAEEAQRAVEAQARKSEDQARELANEANAAAQELARKTNRNMGILGVVVAILIAASQWIGIETAPTAPELVPIPAVTTTAA